MVSANFVCGSVVNADNSSEVSPSWVNVQVYYSEKPTLFTNCQVSPENNKYCCNPRDIQNVTWAVGKTVNAFINESGYVFQNVSKVISGAGFDLFPDLIFEKILNVIQPNSSIYVNISSLNVEVSNANEYNNLDYLLEKNGSMIENVVLCNSCNSSNFSITNLSNGKYSLFIRAYKGNQEYIQNVNFTVLDYLNFQRKIECSGCKGDRIPSTAGIVNFTIIVNSSYPIEGTLQDVFSSDWNYEGEDSVSSYSDSHNIITWQVSGRDIMKTYSLIPPKNAFNSKYIFQSAFGSIYSNENVIALSRFWLLDFIGLKKVYIKNIKPSDRVSNVRVSNENPVVIYPKDMEVTQVAIFPKTPANNVLSFVKKMNKIGLEDSKLSFIVWTSLDESNINQVFIEFYMNQKSIKKNQNVSLFYYSFDNDSWLNVPISVISENKTQINYQAFTNKTGEYTIVIS